MLQKIEEDDYRPMAELLVAGREQPQGFWAGLLDFGKNSVDFRNVDYGSKYKRGLVVGFTMIQLSLLWSIFGRSLIAKVPLGKIGPQYAYSFFWAMWAFGWPWLALYSIEQLRETKPGSTQRAFHTEQGAAQASVDVYRRGRIARRLR